LKQKNWNRRTEGINMTKWGLVVDISKCNACYCCFTACKDEHWDNDYPPYSAAQPRHGQFWMNLIKKERGTYPYIKVAYMPVPCMHCDNAPCIKAAKDGAVYKRPDGVVVIDPEKAVGQKKLVDSCPYGVIFWNEEKNLPQKCTLCVHRLEKGEIPRCVQACPTGALIFGDLDDPKSDVSKLLKSAKAEVFHPEWNANPRVQYIDLYKATKHFIAGAVIYGDTDECAEGVTATLSANGKSVKTTTNNYGNFEFDGLDAARYSVKLASAGYAPKAIDVDLKTDTYLGEIVLTKA
jgi:Fe-S-cluster-containing dehydrogenase component